MLIVSDCVQRRKSVTQGGENKLMGADPDWAQMLDLGGYYK